MTSPAAQKPSICVVLDTNEWIRHKWLGSPIGSSLRFVLRVEPAVVLAIPEVLGIELDKHKGLTAQRINQDLLNAMQDLKSTTGVVRTLSGISSSEIQRAISNRMAEAYHSIIRQELTLRQVRSALKRINDESPPNGKKNQQAKDSLLWEACIDLSEEYQVLLVTGDGGFYRDRKPDRGLAENLAAEGPVRTGRLRVLASIESVLQYIIPDYVTKYPVQSLADIYSPLKRELRSFLELRPTAVDAGLTFHEVRVQYLSAFPGEESNILSVSFSAQGRVTQVSSTEEGVVTAIGECKFDSASNQILDLQLQTIQWLLHNAEGEEIRGTEVFSIGAACEDVPGPPAGLTQQPPGRMPW